MIVELLETTGMYEIECEDGTRWYISEPSNTNFKEFNPEPLHTQLTPAEVAELSKAGFRADDIIRMRKEGIL